MRNSGVEVILPKERGRSASCVMPEDDHRETVNALADSLIRLLCRGQIRAGSVVKDRQLHVVRAFGGRHVRLKAEGTGRNGILPHLIGTDRIAAGIHNVVLELDLIVLPLVIY